MKLPTNKFVLYLLFPVVLIVVFAITGSITYFVLKMSNIFVPKTDEKITTSTTSTQQMELKPQSDSTYSVLLLGYGGEGHDGGNLADVMMLIVADYKSKKAEFISVPRDLWVELPIRSDQKDYYKINASYAIGQDDNNYPYKEPLYKGEAGGGEMAKYAVETVTGIHPDYFVSISFDGFKNVIDALEGVDVDVPVTFNDNYYPIKGLENETCDFTDAEIELFHRQYSGFDLEKQFTCRYEQLHFDKGINHMDGATALKFVRSRHSDTSGGDFERSKRQQAVLVAIKDKLISLGALKNSKQFVDSLSTMVKTDFDLSKTNEFIDLLGNPDEYQIMNINLTTDNVLTNAISSAGAYILIPKEGVGNWNTVRQFVNSEINK